MSLLEILLGGPGSDWAMFAVFFLGIILLIGLAELTRRKIGWSPEVTRKFVHVLIGVLIFLTPFFFTTMRPLIWMAVIFIGVNIAGIKTGKLKGMHDTQRVSYGTVYFPLTFLILTPLLWNQHKSILILSVLILGLADAAAAIVGENLKHPHVFHLGKDKKSVEGSAAMFFMSFFIVGLGLPMVDFLDGMTISFPAALWIGLITACVVTPLEALSSRGSDNLTAPLGAAYVLYYMLAGSLQANIQLFIGLVLAIILATLSFRARFLTAGGSVGTYLLAVLIFGVGGWTWTVPVLTFFILSSFLSKAGKAHKKQFGLMFEKSSRRDFGQVAANGGIAGIVLLCFHFFPGSYWYWIYLGALAAVNADTWATEVGVFSKIQPRLISTFQQVEPGTSGGITPLGTLSALAGSFIIVLSGRIIAAPQFQLSFSSWIFWIIVISGFLANLIDSLLGATVQAQYQCPMCDRITEKKVHCGKKETVLVSGTAWLNNDLVNGFCSLSGALLTGLLCLILFKG